MQYITASIARKTISSIAKLAPSMSGNMLRTTFVINSARQFSTFQSPIVPQAYAVPPRLQQATTRFLSTQKESTIDLMEETEMENELDDDSIMEPYDFSNDPEAHMNVLGIVSMLNLLTTDYFICHPTIVELFGEGFRPWVALGPLTAALVEKCTFVGFPACTPVALDDVAKDWTFDGVLTLTDLYACNATQNAILNIYYRRRFKTVEEAMAVVGAPLGLSIEEAKDLDRTHPDAQLANLYLTEIVGMVATLPDASKIVVYEDGKFIGVSPDVNIDSLRETFNLAEQREINYQTQMAEKHGQNGVEGEEYDMDNIDEMDMNQELNEEEKTRSRNALLAYAITSLLNTKQFLTQPTLNTLGPDWFPLESLRLMSGGGITGYLSPGIFAEHGPDYDIEAGGNAMENLKYDGVIYLDNLSNVENEKYKDATVRLYYSERLDNTKDIATEVVLGSNADFKNLEDEYDHPLMQYAMMHLISIDAVVIETADGEIIVDTANPVDFYRKVAVEEITSQLPEVHRRSILAVENSVETETDEFETDVEDDKKRK